MKYVLSAVVVAILMSGTLLATNNQPTTNADEKMSVEDIMKKGFKGGLLKKVMSEKASDEEKVQLMSMLIDLSENENEKGDAKVWKMMTMNALKASAKVVAGRKDALGALKEATNCKACHDKFK